jgi:hypothetical protein
MVPLNIENADEKPLTYDITVRTVSHSDGNADTEEVVFRTTELINDDGAAAVRGKGTRVWDVQRTKDGQIIPGATGVLKDSWVDSTRDREDKILQQLKIGSELIAQGDEDEQSDPFLTSMASGDVYIEGVADQTPLLLGGDESTKYTSFLLQVPDGQPKISPLTSAAQNALPIYFHSKTHYRIVFVERCVPLMKEVSLYMVFTHLIGAIDGK